MKMHAMTTMTVLLAAMAIANEAEGQVQGQASAGARVTAESRSQAEPRPDAGEEASRSGGGSLDVQAILRATAESGLPNQPVSRIVAEGRAKGVSETEVAEAALRTHARLLLAREALNDGGGREASPQEISLGAEALLRGAAPSDLERLGDAAPEGRSLEASLEALVSLQGRGPSAADAASSVAAGLAASVAGSASAAVGSGAAAAAAQVGAGLTGAIGAGIVP